MMRFCKHCEAEKPAEEFRGRTGKQCWDCRKKKAQAYEDSSKCVRARYVARRVEYAGQTKGKREADRLEKLNWFFIKKYGLTLKARDAMVIKQKGRCAICRHKPSGKRHCGQLHIDHCHATGEIRGMLCTNCNQALGFMKDNSDTFRTAAKYLDRN